jgi:hypothetical protein
VNDEDVGELGPIDYVVVEFPADTAAFCSQLAAELRTLVDRGVVRLPDLLFLRKSLDGWAALEPDRVATVVLWENVWAARLDSAVRRSGGQCVASGRIPTEALLAALEADEAAREE